MANYTLYYCAIHHIHLDFCFWTGRVMCSTSRACVLFALARLSWWGTLAELQSSKHTGEVTFTHLHLSCWTAHQPSIRRRDAMETASGSCWFSVGEIVYSRNSKTEVEPKCRFLLIVRKAVFYDICHHSQNCILDTVQPSSHITQTGSNWGGTQWPHRREPCLQHTNH